MAAAFRVGDEARLPSGLRVLITAAAEPLRPWGAVFLGRHWHVIRECAPGANCLGVEHYFGGGVVPLQFDERDARALATTLNAVKR
jgi:hypothetical protein